MAIDFKTPGKIDDSELHAQIDMLPNPEEVSAVVSQLKTDDLREFATAIMNASVQAVLSGHIDIETTRFLNGWFASMEETIAAGDDIDAILSRRRAPENFDDENAVHVYHANTRGDVYR